MVLCRVFANFPVYLNPEGISVVFYDQLGGGNSERPEDPELWQINRFVEELHEVVTQLDLQQQYAFANSTGVILLTEYLLRYPNSFKGIIFSGMPADFQKFQENVLLLRNKLPEEVLNRFKKLESEGKAGSEEYQGLVFPQWYQRHFCLLPQWPEAIMKNLQQAGYPVMQQMIGGSPFFFSGNLVHWKREEELNQIKTPCLLIGFPQDVVLEEDYKLWQENLPNASYIRGSHGGHLGWWDVPEEFFSHLQGFIRSVENSSAAKS